MSFDFAALFASNKIQNSPISASSIEGLDSATNKLVNSYSSASIFQASSYTPTSNSSSPATSTNSTIDSSIFTSSSGGIGGATSSLVDRYTNAFSNIKITPSSNSSSSSSGSYSSNLPDNRMSIDNFNFGDNMTSQQKSALAKFKENYEQNKQRYKAVEEKTGVPAELIASLHWRESTGSFGTYLHNGDPLGTPTTHVPKGKLFYNWEDAAVDALMSKTNNINKNDISSYYDYAERYNGLGYKSKGLPSPYVWAGTTNYSKGKYVADHKFDANAVDKQLGVAVMLKSIMA